MKNFGFTPCSPRELERVAGRHRQLLEQSAPLSAAPQPGKAKYCLAIDGTMIPGLPDAVEHRLRWHEVKLAVGFDVHKVRPPFTWLGAKRLSTLANGCGNNCKVADWTTTVFN